MIIKDQKASLDIANNIKNKVLALINNEMKELKIEDDPAENVYIAGHTIAIILVSIIASLEEYGKTYGVNNFDRKQIKKWIDTIYDEYFKVSDED